MAFPQRRQCLFVSTPLFPRRLVPAFQPSHQITPPRPILQPISLARKKFAKGESSPQRRSRRKTGADISRDREARARQSKHRRPLIAQWSGAVLAESTNYEVRFIFPYLQSSHIYISHTDEQFDFDSLIDMSICSS